MYLWKFGLVMVIGSKDKSADKYFSLLYELGDLENKWVTVILFGHFYSLLWESFPIQKWPLFSQISILVLIFPIFMIYFPKCERKGSFPKSQMKSLGNYRQDFKKVWG